MSPIKADFPESSGSHREREKPVYFSKRARSILQDVYATNGGKTPNEQEREALAKELSKLDGRLYLEKKITFWFYNRRKNQRAAAGRKAESTAEKADMSARSGPVETILRSIPADDLKSWAAVSKTLKDNGLEVARDTQRLLELQRAIYESSMRSNMPLEPEQQKSTVLSQLPTPASSKSPEIKPRDSPAAISPIEGSPSLYSHLLPPVYNTSPSSSSTGALLKNDQSSETLSQSSQAATTPEPLCFKDAEKSVQPATPPASASTVRAPETMDVDEPTHQVALPTALAPACATPVMSQVLWDAQSVTTDKTPPIPYWEIKTADPRRRHPANRYSAGDSTAVTPAAPSAMAKNVAPPPLKSTSSARTVDPRRRPNTMPAQVTSSRVTGPSSMPLYRNQVAQIVPLEPTDFFPHPAPTNATEFAAIYTPHADVVKRVLHRHSTLSMDLTQQ